MRILATVAHYFDSQGVGPYSSLTGNVASRVAGLTSCILAFHQLFSRSQYLLRIAPTAAVRVNKAQGHDIDVVVCTTREQHLLAHLSLPESAFRQHTTQAEPLFLGFECHAVLRDGIGQYDYFCYLEDDLVIHDPWFFRKLAWFHRRTDGLSLLQPNRYEVAANGPVRKFYLDGDLAPRVTAAFQNVQDQPEIAADFLDQTVRFARTLNPHSGSFFLSAEQMVHWAKQPYFLDRDCSFIGPLESAATLGIMRAFRVYKPPAENPDFLEIQHFDTKHLGAIGAQIPWEKE